MPGQPLPSLEQARLLPLVGPIEDVLDVYRTYILPAEAADDSQAGHKNVIFIRILGYLLLYPLNESACATVRVQTKNCVCPLLKETNSKLYDLGKFYFENFIRVCESFLRSRDAFRLRSLALVLVKKTRGAPTPPTYPSQPSCDRKMEDLLRDLPHQPKDHQSAKEKVSSYLSEYVPR